MPKVSEDYQVKSEPLHVLLTQEQKEELLEVARKSNQSLGAYVRTRLFEEAKGQ